MNTNRINPKMLTLARESRGILQNELAEQLKLSQGSISKIEQEQSTITPEIIALASKTLAYPQSFFFQDGEVLPSTLSYRKRDTVAQKLLTPIEAQVNLYRLNVETLLEKTKQPAPKLPVLDIREYKTPEAIARQLRKMWKVPKGPIKDMAGLLEEHGIILISFDFGTERVDSRTAITRNGWPIIFLNKTMLGDRQRFSMAFELGHLVMHLFTPPSFDVDVHHEANVFAAEFLMPNEDIRTDLQDLNIPKLAELKRKWKVSMQALLFKASDLQIISANQKRYLLEQFNKMNIRRREPAELDIPQEKPLLLRDMITKYRKSQRMSISDMAGFFHLHEEEFLKKYA